LENVVFKLELFEFSAKWYVKAYSDFYKYSKIIDCIENNNFSELNKNLKSEALTIQIVK
jgi:hypothetical protein